MRARIVIVIPKYGLVGGAEGYAAEVTERIAENPSFEIHVLANQWSGNSDRITFHKIPIISFPKFLTTISFAHFASKKIAEMKFDLIHTHDRIFSADVFTMHGIPHRIWTKEVRKKRWMSLFDRATAWVERCLIEDGRCQKYLPVSGLTQQKFMEEYPSIDFKKMEIVPPGINTAQFRPVPEESRSIKRRELGIVPDEVAILFVSMNFDIKGLDVLLQGLAGIKANRPEKKWKLLIIGKGDVQSYAQISARLKIREHIVFTGTVSKGQLPEIYAACDVFAMPSKFDTFGMTVLEAMAAGLPVVISDTVGARDIVEEGVNGFVVAGAKKAEAIRDRLELLMEDSRRRVMAEAARRTALDHSWEAVAKKVELVYKETLKKKGTLS